MKTAKRFVLMSLSSVVGLAFCLNSSLPLAIAAGDKPTADRASKPPIKIGFLTSYAGPAAEIGQAQVDGFNLYLDQVHHEMAGRKVELIVEDDGSKPAQGAMKVEKLPGLVVQTSLISQLLIEMCRAGQPGMRLTHFEFTTLGQTYDTGSFTLAGSPTNDGREASLWSLDASGKVALMGSAKFAP